MADKDYKELQLQLVETEPVYDRLSENQINQMIFSNTNTRLQ